MEGAGGSDALISLYVEAEKFISEEKSRITVVRKMLGTVGKKGRQRRPGGGAPNVAR